MGPVSEDSSPYRVEQFGKLLSHSRQPSGIFRQSTQPREAFLGHNSQWTKHRGLSKVGEHLKRPEKPSEKPGFYTIYIVTMIQSSLLLIVVLIISVLVLLIEEPALHHGQLVE